MYLITYGVRICFSMMCLVLSTLAPASTLDKFNPADYVQATECPMHYSLKKGEEGDTCAADTAKISTLDESDCKAPHLKFENNSCTHVEENLDPQCKSIPGYTSNIKGEGKEAKCSYERTIPVSAAGDYISDCFHIKGTPAGTDLVPGQYYIVTDQRIIDDDDRELSLVTSTDYWHWPPPPGCTAKIGGTQHQVMASQLIGAGASRRGYTYGFLTMPYKYFPSEKSFLINVPIGGYMGLRYGQAGSGTTFAFAVTLSSVKADTVDPAKLDAAGKPTIIGTADVSALSGAVGFIFDVLKSPAGKPFKSGIFVGKDFVNRDPTVEYRFNRKTWVAIQLGYDFTDN